MEFLHDPIIKAWTRELYTYLCFKEETTKEAAQLQSLLSLAEQHAWTYLNLFGHSLSPLLFYKLDDKDKNLKSKETIEDTKKEDSTLFMRGLRFLDLLCALPKSGFFFQKNISTFVFPFLHAMIDKFPFDFMHGASAAEVAQIVERWLLHSVFDRTLLASFRHTLLDRRLQSLDRVESSLQLVSASSSKTCKTCGQSMSDPTRFDRHLDWHFQMARHQMNKTSTSLSCSRGWFLDKKEWSLSPHEKKISFFEQEAQKKDLALFPEEKEKEKEKTEPDPLLAESLDSSPECVICKEPFRSRFSDEHETWILVDAMVVTPTHTLKFPKTKTKTQPLVGATVHQDCWRLISE